MATNINFGDTKFVNDLYPIQGGNEVTIVFKPMKLISSANFRKECEKKGKLTPEEIELLDYMFGDSSSIADTVGHDFDDEEEEMDDFDDIWFHNPGSVTMRISTSGKEDNPSEFFWMRHTYKNTPKLASFLNFMFHQNGEFFGIKSSGFLSHIKSAAYNKETHKYDQKELEDLHKAFNDGNYDNEGSDFLSEVNFKCGKTSISKILISLLPELAMEDIVTLSDFINSERLSSRSDDEVSKNIFELKGELITYFYNMKNYLYPKEGTLGNSCMRYDNTTEQIRFYANNPSNVALLAYIENKKLLARAVLWTSVSGQKFSDRIYCSSSKYGTLLTAYCKQKGYKTVHYGTSIDYGLEKASPDCIVKLDTFELAKSHYPYLDSMAWIDVINKYIAPDGNALTKYMSDLGMEFLVKNINSVNNGCGDSQVTFHKGKTNRLKYLRDSQGREISRNLWEYAIIRKPKLSIVNCKDIITLNDNDRVDAVWCETTLINKYHCIRPTLLLNTSAEYSAKYVIRYMDKQYVVYSTYHKLYILKKESVYIPSIKSFVLSSAVQSSSFQDFLRLSKLRRMYSNKLVRITPEYLSSLREQISLLPFKESLMDIRKSRVYNVSAKNVLCSGVKIKGIVIPFKQLRLVKK